MGAFNFSAIWSNSRVGALASCASEDSDLRRDIQHRRRAFQQGRFRAADRLHGIKRQRMRRQVASCSAVSPEITITDTPRLASAVLIAISSTLGIWLGWEMNSQ